MSIRTGNVEYIMRLISVSKVRFSLVDSLLNLIVLLVTQNAMQRIFCSSQNACVEYMQKVSNLINIFTQFIRFIRVGGVKIIVHSIHLYIFIQGRRRRGGAAGACAPALSKVGGGHKWV